MESCLELRLMTIRMALRASISDAVKGTIFVGCRWVGDFHEKFIFYLPTRGQRVNCYSWSWRSVYTRDSTSCLVMSESRLSFAIDPPVYRTAPFFCSTDLLSHLALIIRYVLTQFRVCERFGGSFFFLAKWLIAHQTYCASLHLPLGQVPSKSAKTFITLLS